MAKHRNKLFVSAGHHNLKGEYAQSLEILNDLINKYPKEEKYYAMRAVSFRGLKDFKNAITDLKKAFELADDYEKLNIKNRIKEFENEANYTSDKLVENYCTPLFKAALEGDFLKVQDLINEGVDIELGKNARQSNLSPLSVAVKQDHLAIVQFLIKNGANLEAESDINIYDGPRYWTPLMYAANANNQEMMELLVNNGANINFVDNEDWGVVKLVLESLSGKRNEIGEKQAQWLIKLGAPITKSAQKILDEIESSRKNEERIQANKEKYQNRNEHIKYYILSSSIDYDNSKEYLFKIDNYPLSEDIDSFEYDEGIPLKGKFPLDASVQFSTTFRNDKANFSSELKKGFVLKDFLSNDLGVLIANKRVYEILLKLNAINLEFLPLDLFSPKKELISKDYGIINPLDIQNCIDIENSALTEDILFPDEFKSIQNLVLDRSNIDEAAMIFRANRLRKRILIREDVAHAFEMANITGYKLDDADGFSD